MTDLSDPGTGFDCSCRVENGGGDGYGEGKRWWLMEMFC